MKKILLLKLVVLSTFILLRITGRTQNEPVHPAVIGTGVYLGETPPLIDIPPLTNGQIEDMKQMALEKAAKKKIETRMYPYSETALPIKSDEVWQKIMGKSAGSRTLEVNFEGQTTWSFPPDCSGASGPNHFVQTVNLTYSIYDKTGDLLAGPTAINTLFTGLPGSQYNDGDPIVLFDELADRWLIAEFSTSGSNDYMMIAVSATNNPTGTWYKYSFDVDDIPDYPKIGVWQDGYYMGVNNNLGKDTYVFQRSVMLAGGTAPQMVGFNNLWRPGWTGLSFRCVPPIDNDGEAAPEGAPGMFIAFNDDAWLGSDQLWLYELDVDWSTPANSSFQRIQQLNVTPFDSNFGTSWDNITQPNSQKLDAVPQVIMNVPQYRNFGTYQSIVCCHTVDVDATNHAGIRWYELRKTTGSSVWTIRQQGTYAPDDKSRWMGSIMLNGNGQIALGYSISSSTTYPGIRYCGQSSSAYNISNGILDIPEEIIHAGSNAQISYNRWGDYALMSVDPTDDRTFWFTSEYVKSGGLEKGTKIASIRFYPDLTILNQFISPNSALPGSAITAICTIKNLGPGNDETGSILKYFLSKDQTLDNGDQLLYSYAIQSLSANTQTNKSVNLTIPTNAELGTQYILFYIDPENLVEEADENNNMVTQPLTILAYDHDYSITNISILPANPIQGQTVTVNATLKNVGLNTEASGQQVKFFVDGAYNNSTTTIPSLAPNATTPVNFSWIATNGAHNLKVQSYLSGDQNSSNDYMEIPIYVGTVGNLIIDGTTNPVKNLTLSPATYSDLTLQLQNTGSAAINGTVTKGGAQSAWVTLSSGTSFSLNPLQTSSYNYRVTVPAGTAIGNYTANITFNYNGGSNVVTLNISVVQYSPGNYEHTFTTSNTLINGSAQSTTILTHYYNNLNFFNLDNDPATTYPTLLDNTKTLTVDEYNRVNASNWTISSAVELESWGTTSHLDIRIPETSYTNQISNTTYNVNLNTLEKLNNGLNTFRLALDNFVQNAGDVTWDISNSQVSLRFSQAAWASSHNIPQTTFNQMQAGLDYCRLYFDVTSVNTAGDLLLFNNGKQVDYEVVSNTGNNRYFTLSSNEFFTSNYFNIKGVASDNTRVNISNIRLVIHYFSGDPNLVCTKTLSLNSSEINQNVTVNLSFQNIGTNIADEPFYDDSPLPSGLTLVSGSLSGDPGDVDPGLTEAASYIIKGIDVGNFTFGATNVVYENPGGDTFSTTFNAVNLTINGGTLMINGQIDNPTIGLGVPINISASVVGSILNNNVSDAQVLCTIFKPDNTQIQFYLLYNQVTQLYTGTYDQTDLYGSYQIGIAAVRQFYNDGVLTPELTFEVIDQSIYLIPDFTADNISGDAPFSVNFTDFSFAHNTTITSWYWDFGDGSNSFIQNPQHIFENPGSYSITLTITDGTITESISKQNYITVYATPIITVNPSALFFGTITVGSSSYSQSYTIAGNNLTASITVSAPAGFAVSFESNGPWTSFITLPQTGGNVNAIVYVRFSPTSATTYSGNITNASAGATTQNVAVSGTGLTPCPVSVIIAPSANPVCSGTSVTFTATPTNGGTSPTYQWKRNGTNVGTNSPTYVLSPNNNDVITCMLTSNLTCATGNPATSNPISMTVNPTLPVSVSIAASANPVCSGTSVTFTATPTNGGTSPTYQWKRNGTNVGTDSPTFVLSPVNGDVITCLLISNLSCSTGNPATSNQINMTVNPVPPQPGVISGNSSVCQGTPQTYSIQPVSGATSYTWSLPPGWTGSSTSTSIATTVGPNSGNISVVANNSCGPGPERVIIVGVGTIPPQPGEITGNTTTSQGITEIYSIEPVAGATSYSWTLPAGWSGNSTTTSITTTVGASGGSVTVAAVNACGTGTPSTKNVNVTATPLILVSPETLAFGNVNIGSSSVPQSYNVQGSNLTSNVLVSAQEGFSLSLSLSGPWNTALSLVPNLGIVNTTVFVQFTPTAQVPYSGIITNASGGATTRNVAVTGTGDIPGLEVTPLSRSVASSSGNTIYDVTCNTSWTSLSSEPWCVVTGSGNGTGTITATYEANTTNASRTAFITVSTPGLPEVVVSLVQAGSEFEISARNLVQTAPNVLEFDVYLLDVDASAPFELASVQLGFLLNSGICAGGTLSAQYDNSGSGLLPVQQFTASASVVQTLAGYPNQTLIRLVGKTPPGTGNGTIISATSPGTLLTHFILTSTVPFTGNSTPDMTFTSSTVTVPLYATKVAAYIGGINTQLLVTPGANALIVGNPLLNGPPELSINPLIHDVDSEEGSVGFSLESNASWTAQSNQSWCSVTPSGFGSGTLTATYSANAGVARSAQITVTVAGLSPVVLTLNQQGYETKVLNLYALLEGLYNGNGTMDQAGDEYGAHFPSGVADLVNIELHDAADYGIIRLLITNVELGTNGIAIIDIPQEFSDSYYITIKHRNSIETTSASPVSFSEPVTDYAFDLPSKAHGNNMQLMVDGYYVIFGGDVNVDDAVDTGDMTLVDNESTNYTAGYVSEDVNGDGQVDTGDMIVVDNNAAQYVGAVFPASTSVLMVSTLPVNGITRTTATCGGNVIAQGPLPVIDRGVCWSTSPEPDVTDDHTSDGSGSGQFTSNLTNLTPGTLYYIRAYAVNSSETVYGSVITFYTVLYTNGNGLTDIHGNQYPTIVLGTQEWLAENLRVTKYSNGDNIPNVTNGTWSSLTTGAYRWYNDDEANYKNNYGGLYNWYAVTDSRKLCPSGWRSPNTADWATLSAFLGGPELAGGKMKSTRTSPLAHPRWDQPNAGATDISGFGGYPGGYCLHTGNFGESGLSGYWWNATPEGNNSATMRALLNTDDNLYADNSFRQAAFSARCIRETTTAAISTSSVTNITGVTAVCGGNITSDGGSQITQRGVCWSTDPDPTIEDFYTVNGSGTGSYESNMEGLSINTVYYVRAYAINGAGVAYGAGQAISFRTLFFVEGNGVTDNSGNNYSSVFLGTQEWMAENLRTANYRNGDAIPNVTNATEWIGLSTGAWCYYNNNSQLENPYGKYYNWYAVTDTRQLCPTGWQIPTDADWTVLTDFLGGIYTADERLKEADFAHWSPSGYNGDNSSGFTGLPGGRRHYTNGSSLYMSELGYHWSSTQATPTTAWCRVLGYQYSGVSRSEYNFKNGITVRCMRQVSTPVVVTNSINSITGISAMGGGTITSDGGSPVTQRGLCWSTASNPTIDGNHTSEGPGSGDFTSAISGLSPNTVYYVRAYATNSAGTSYGNNQSFTSALFIPGLGVTDIDNNTYPTIILGTQEWMAENLKVTHYRNGDLIPNITEIAQWNSLSTGAFCWYNNDVNWKDAYGGLYNWYTVADNRNVCPSGWHIPTDAEWTVLTNYLGGAVVAGGKLKSTRTTPDISPRWDLPNTGATNQSGFSGFPGGYREYDGAFNNNGQEGAWWGSTQGSSIGAYGRVLNFDNENTDRGNYFMKDGFSVRCLKD